MPSTCFAGRIIVRSDRLGGLDWTTPCPVPAENILEFDPPMYFCSPHMEPITFVMYDRLVAMGAVLPGILGGPVEPAEDALESLLDDPERQ